MLKYCSMLSRVLTTGMLVAAVVLGIIAIVHWQSSFLLGSAYASEMATDMDDTFTIVVIPDTQYYAARYPHIFESITKWIAENLEERKIEFVLHVGDITDNNSAAQWQVARKNMSILDGVVPYVLTLGNHDYVGDAVIRETQLNEVFSLKNFESLPTFGGVFEEGKLDNAYYLFKVGDINYIVVSLEFGPRNEVLKWANEVVASYPDHKGIVVTHCYMYFDDTRVGAGDKWNPKIYSIGYAITETVNDGEDMWTKFVSKHENIFLVVSGHIPYERISKRIDAGQNGNYVLQILADFQGVNQGGDGYLLLLEVSPSQNRICAEVYSPYLDEYMYGSDVNWCASMNEGTIIGVDE